MLSFHAEASNASSMFESFSDKTDPSRIINVYGEKGVGKSRTVMEVAEYLNFRFKFGSGTYVIDLEEINAINKAHSLVNKKLDNTTNFDLTMTMGMRQSVQSN